MPSEQTYVQRDQPPGVPPLELTGERTLPDVPQENYWYQRHLVVYEWVAERVAGKRVIDMACGEGYGAEILARKPAAAPVTALAWSADGRKLASARTRGALSADRAGTSGVSAR